MKQPNQPLRIFLIHAHADRKPVHKLYTRLIQDGLDAWMDIENLQPGQDWQNEIRKAIIQADIVLVCLSKVFNEQQGYRHEEVKLALEKANFLPEDVISIIPIRLEICDMPESLSHLQRVDLFVAGGYKKLIKSLKGKV
ncbi:MAG: toll/interleukin-1 receptor domain-containing protein [Anaerolineales bacterium]